MLTKLTLRLDKELIEAAKHHAQNCGKSVSQMVADYFSLLGVRPSSRVKLTPKVKSLKGALKLKDVGEEDYRRYVEEKYQ